MAAPLKVQDSLGRVEGIHIDRVLDEWELRREQQVKEEEHQVHWLQRVTQAEVDA